MNRKSSKGQRTKDINATNERPRREEHKTVETIVEKIVYKTPTKSADYYLQDEQWDILPKTNYTYARSGSYSPRFLKRTVVSPNMSRYRIHGRRSGVTPPLEQDHGYGAEFTDDSDIEEYGDGDSDISYERVLKDGMHLRSGHKLTNLVEILHEHDSKIQQSELIHSTSRSPYTTSKLETTSRSTRGQLNQNLNAHSHSTSKKDMKSLHNQRQYSQSERKHSHTSTSTSNIDSRTGVYSSNHNAVQSRRNLQSDFNKNMSQSYIDQNQSASRNTRLARSRDSVDSRGFIKTTVHETVTEEYQALDRGVQEKGAIEGSEKAERARQRGKAPANSKNLVRLYGMDSETEFSDTDSGESRWSGYSNGSRYSRSSSGPSQTSSVTTVITTVTETISTVTRPVWNTIGKPVWNNLGRPISTVVTTLLYIGWLLVSRPIMFLVASVGEVLGWFKRQALSGEIADSASHLSATVWSRIETFVWQFTLLDAWMFQRRGRRGCCLCLPLLLLLPLLIAVMSGYTGTDGKSSFLAMFARDKTASPIIVNEKSEYWQQLNTEVHSMMVQLQSDRNKQLTVEDVEAIVFRIVGRETDTLKADLVGRQNEQAHDQVQWKAEQELKLLDIQKQRDELLATIQGMEAEIASQKSSMAIQSDEMRVESSQTVVGLEEKLAALHVQLQSQQDEYTALVARVNACCHNETYYAAAVKDSVNVILAEMMAGHMSGNPSQDAFTDWLHTHYVSREVLDERLKGLATELTASVMAMFKDMEENQQQKFVDLQQQQQQQQNLQQQSVHVSANGSGIGEQVHQVRQMIEEALFRYSADKTGIADFALESGGGSVVSTRCSETYHRKTALVSVFGFPLWYTSNSPRTVIQPAVNPGECWAFRGATGYIVIKTSSRIQPTGFTLEHIPKSLAPSGSIDSAPRDFTVIGLSRENDDAGVSLGNYTYQDDGKPMQFFPVQVASLSQPFFLYELRILNNHGNLEYTCLYRFRIHGKPLRE